MLYLALRNLSAIFLIKWYGYDSVTQHPQDQTAAADAVGGAFGESVGRTFRALRSLISRTGWMRPAQSCRLMSGAEFGRNIQKELKALGGKDGPKVLAVSIRKRMKAVVITPEQYEEMRQMREKLEALVVAQARIDMQDSLGHFDALYLRITSERSRAASEALFSVTGEDLANSHRPGATENAR